VGLAESGVPSGKMATGNVINAISGEKAITQKRVGLFEDLVPGLKPLWPTRLCRIQTSSPLPVTAFCFITTACKPIRLNVPRISKM
jgi:hypothetical protein